MAKFTRSAIVDYVRDNWMQRFGNNPERLKNATYIDKSRKYEKAVNKVVIFGYNTPTEIDVEFGFEINEQLMSLPPNKVDVAATSTSSLPCCPRRCRALAARPWWPHKMPIARSLLPFFEQASAS